MKKLLLFVSIFIGSLCFAQQAGQLDETFNPIDNGTYGYGCNGTSETISTAALQPDGKIIAFGNFVNYNDIAGLKSIVRLNTDGSVDTGFSVSTGQNFLVTSILVQPDFKIILTGYLPTLSNNPVARVARLNPDGSVDDTFTFGTGNGGVGNSVLLPDGKILVSGSFTTFNGTTSRGLVRLNTDGSVDNTFNTGNGPAILDIRSLVLQPDGKILIGGDFTSYNGVARNRIARLNSDGSLDTSFNPGSGADSFISAIALQGDGKILAGGNFNAFDGITYKKIVRLNSNGSIDNSFDAGDAPALETRSIAVQPGGKIIVAGNFHYDDTITGTVRLNQDGSIDTSFGIEPDNYIPSQFIMVQQDGSVFICGYFKAVNKVTRYGIAKLDAEGFPTQEFSPGTSANNSITALALQPDGKILIGGYFTSFNDTWRKGIARLNTDGTLDTSFSHPDMREAMIHSISVQADGKIIIAGDYGDNFNYPNIARINADGSPDASFDPGTGANQQIQQTAVQPDGKIIISGVFTAFNGVARKYIARLNTDGSIDTSFVPGLPETSSWISAFILLPDGKIIVRGLISGGGNFVLRLNDNGSIDPTYNIGTINGGAGHLSLQPDGKIIISGIQTSYNGSPIAHIARIDADGSLDNSFSYGAEGISMTFQTAVQADGKIIFTQGTPGSAMASFVRVNPDGTIDNDFDSGSGFNAINAGTATVGYRFAIQPDGKIIVAGTFSEYNGTAKRRIARLWGSDAPVGASAGFEKGNLKYYPNPVNDILNISAETAISQVTVYNVLGQVVQMQKPGHQNVLLDLSRLSAGNYIVQVLSDKGAESIKIIKQ